MSASLHPVKWHWFFLDSTKNNKTTIYRLVNGNAQKRSIADSVEEFEVMKNYMFITTRKVSDYAVIIILVSWEVDIIKLCQVKRLDAKGSWYLQSSDS